MFNSTSYLSETSNKVAQTYMLASKVKTKLTNEAVKNDINLVKLVTQANLLDKLIENINKLQSATSINQSKFTFESINENTYPLLATANNNYNESVALNNNINDNNNDSVDEGDDDDDDDDDEGDDDLDDDLDVHVETNTIYPEDFGGSDESDFDSEYSSDSELDDNDIVNNVENNFDNPLHACISHDLLCESLEKLNFYQTLVEETDSSSWNRDLYDEREITCEIVSDAESESSTFSSDENDSDSLETANTLDNWIRDDNKEQDLSDISTLPQLSKFNSYSKHSQADCILSNDNNNNTGNNAIDNFLNKMYSVGDIFSSSKSC